MRHINDFVEREVPQYIRGSVLDVGGGKGRWKKILEQYAVRYFISDLFSEGADFKDDARNLSNENNIFDTVVCFEVLEHIDDTEKVISEIYRVLKEGGYAIATAPFIFPYHPNPGDYYRFTPNGLEYVFEKAGFEIVETGNQGNLLTIIGIYCKQKFKNYDRNGSSMSFLKKKFFLYLHRIFLYLDWKFPVKNQFFYTHSYVIGRKK